MKKLSGLMIMTVLLALIGCASGGSDALAGTAWQLESIDGQPALADVRVTLTFDDGQVNGYAGCNGFGGDYTASASDVSMPNIHSTMMYCETPAGVTEQEMLYLEALNTTRHYIISGDRLELSGKHGLTFTRLATQ